VKGASYYGAPFLGLIKGNSLKTELQHLWMLQKTEQETEDIQIKLRTYPLQVEHLQKQLEELDRKKSE